MALTTFTAFVAALADMSVTGVTRAYDEPPQQVNTADLPISFPRLPMVGEGPLTGSTAQGGWPRFRCELVVLLEPVEQNTNIVNFALVKTMVDNLTTAFRGTSLAKTKTNWTIRQERTPVGNVLYWALIVTAEANG